MSCIQPFHSSVCSRASTLGDRQLRSEHAAATQMASQRSQKLRGSVCFAPRGTRSVRSQRYMNAIHSANSEPWRSDVATSRSSQRATPARGGGESPRVGEPGGAAAAARSTSSGPLATSSYAAPAGAPPAPARRPHSAPIQAPTVTTPRIATANWPAVWTSVPCAPSACTSADAAPTPTAKPHPTDACGPSRANTLAMDDDGRVRACEQTLDERRPCGRAATRAATATA